MVIFKGLSSNGTYSTLQNVLVVLCVGLSNVFSQLIITLFPLKCSGYSLCQWCVGMVGSQSEPQYQAHSLSLIPPFASLFSISHPFLFLPISLSLFRFLAFFLSRTQFERTLLIKHLQYYITSQPLVNSEAWASPKYLWWCRRTYKPRDLTCILWYIFTHI